MRTYLIFFFWFVFGALALGNNAHRVAYQLTPQVVQRGVETKVLLEGNQLENVEGILTYSEGLSFVRVESAAEVVKEIYGERREFRPGQDAVLVLAVDEKCAIGEHLIRVRTRETVSELITLWVSPYPCVREARPFESNHAVPLKETDMEKVQEVKLGTTVWGDFPGYSNFDQDFFGVELKKGERLTVEVWGACYGFTVDASLRLFGPDKESILTVDDTVLRENDPFLSYVAKEAGTHYVSVHPFNDDENQTWVYSIHFGGGKRPTLAYPMGGRAGTKLKVTMLGDVAGDYEEVIEMPKKAGLFEESMFGHRPGGAVIPVYLNGCDFDNVLEDGAVHGSEEKAQVYEGDLPVAFNGKIESAGEVDWFRFRAKKGERYLVRTYAGTFGSALDPALIIKPAEGTESRVKLEGDDSTWLDHDWCSNGRWRCKDLADPVVVFEPDADGEYLLGVWDNQRLFGPEHVYRVEFQPARDRIWFKNTADYRESMDKRDSIVIHAGNSIERTYQVLVPKVTKFEGEFEVVVKGLPEGVAYRAPRLTRGSRVFQMIFEAKKGMKPWSGFPEIELRKVEGGAYLDGGFRLVHSRAVGRGGLCSGSYRRTSKFPLAVVGEAPLRVMVEKPAMGLAQNAFIDLEVKVDRSQGYEGAVIVRALWVPDHVTSAPPLTIEAGEESATYRLTASDRAKAGSFPFTLTGHEAEGVSITTGLGFHFVSSASVEVTIVEPYLEITLGRSAVERGKDGVIKGTIKHVRPVPVGTTATLTNLPTGVKLLGDVKVTPEMKEISFPVRATSAALLGQAGEITCQVTVPEGGQAIVQRTGVAVLRIDEERK